MYKQQSHRKKPKLLKLCPTKSPISTSTKSPFNTKLTALRKTTFTSRLQRSKQYTHSKLSFSVSSSKDEQAKQSPQTLDELPFHTKTDLYGATRTNYISDLENLPNGAHVSISGWIDRIRPMGQLFFVVLRDHTGTVQATLEKCELDQHHDIFEKMNHNRAVETKTIQTVTPTTERGYISTNLINTEIDMATVSYNAYETGMHLGPEYVVSVKGVLQSRPAEMKKTNQTMGSKEIRIRSLRLLNTSKPIPISLHDQHNEISNEDTRMKFRYLDLRRDANQYVLRLRSQLTMAARQAMYYIGFNEIETPYLVKSTPEGAREFLVPSRTPGKFYALPQSPQQFKQLLMCSGFDKYFQIARCFRDESGRQDRQPEFTQLDLELAFTTPEHVMHSVETMVNAMHLQTYGVPMKPLKKLRYIDVMNRFGSDKPDIRYSNELHDITSIFINEMISNNISDQLNNSHNNNTKKYILRANGKIDVFPFNENISLDENGEIGIEMNQTEFLQNLTHENANDDTVQQLLQIYPPLLTAYHDLQTTGFFGHFIQTRKEKHDSITNTIQTDTEIALHVPIANTSLQNQPSTESSPLQSQYTIKPLARHPFPVVKMIIARDLNDILSKSKNKNIMDKILRDCREGSNGLQPTIISCNKWKIKSSQKVLNKQNVQKELQAKYNLSSNDLVFVLSGDWENVCNGLGKIRLNLKSLLKDGSDQLLPAYIDGDRITPPKALSELNDTETSELNMNPYTRFTDYLIQDSWKQQNAHQSMQNNFHHRQVLNPTGKIPTFHWVVDFPLFEPIIPTTLYSRTSNNTFNPIDTNDLLSKVDFITINAMHHPFTAPHPEDMTEFNAITAKFESAIKKTSTGEPIYTTPEHLKSSSSLQQIEQIDTCGDKIDKNNNNAIFHTQMDPITNYPLDLATVSQQLGQIRALHYDLVSNGLEVGGGSIRIHNPDIQRSVFNILQVPHMKFNHLLSALELGAPPHGGFAAGLDRLIAIFGSNAMSHHTRINSGDPLRLKDVIAFPKSSTGSDLLLGTPNEQTKQQLDEYSIQIKEINNLKQIGDKL